MIWITMNKNSLTFHHRLDIGHEIWDAFVDTCDEAWLWHRFDLQDAISTWPGKHDLSFAVRDDASGGRIVALIPIHLIETRRLYTFKWNILDSLGGPACANDLGVKQKRKILEFAISQISTLAKKHNAVEINFALSPMAPAFRGEQCPRVNPLLETGCENTLTQTWVIDLRRSEGEIRHAYAELTKRELKKMQEMGYEIREANETGDVETYYGLHCETYHQSGVRPHPISYFQQIYEKFVSKGLSRIIFLIRNGNVIAAQNSGLYKKGCVYWTGASRSQKTGGENRILFDDQIIFAKRRTFEWYEVGEAFPNQRWGKLKGLNDFKRSFGGGLFPYYRGRIIFNPKWHSLWRFVHTWRTHT
jgi:hypothetical protein